MKAWDLESRNEAISAMLIKPYLNFGPDRPKWAILADALIANHAIKKPKTDRGALINTFLQTWNTNVLTLPELLRFMVGTTEKYGFLFKDIEPTQEMKEQMPIWHHVAEDVHKKHENVSVTTKCLQKKHKMVYTKDAVQIASQLDDKNHVPHSECLCDRCDLDRKVYHCLNPHKCVILAEKKLSGLLKKWDPRQKTDTLTPDHQETPSTPNEDLNSDDNYLLQLPKAIKELKEGFRVFTSYTDHNATQDPPVPAPRKLETESDTEIWIASATLDERHDNARSGCGVIVKDCPTKSLTIRIPMQLPQTRHNALLVGILTAIQITPPNVRLAIHTDSKTIARSLSSKLETWEDKGFVGMENRIILQAIAARIRGRIARTEIIIDDGSPQTLYLSDAYKLANEATLKHTTDKVDWSTPEETRRPGVKVTALTQAIANKAIIELKTRSKEMDRKTTKKNLIIIKRDLTRPNGFTPTSKDIWLAIRREAFSRRIKNFMYLMIHGAQRTGGYWKHIPSCQDRQMCKHCPGTEESMEHILIECNGTPVCRTIWRKTRELLHSRDPTPWPEITYGTIMGCGTVRIYTAGRKIDEGRSRLFRLAVSEAAHLIWTTRCNIIVKDEAIPVVSHIESLWSIAINSRLAEDRLLTNKFQFKTKALQKAVVLDTWRGTLKSKGSIPVDWIRGPEVLVGIGRQNVLTAEEDKESLADDDSLFEFQDNS
ncbi:hypothetical protein C8J56DRAFT_895093 [Mycena floridula]|nr:hypothetical protein C8J56DRAFT_895093 [Mycena floridula]